MLNTNAPPFTPVSIRVKDATLNEHAQPFEPVYRDQRSLFLTFSNGFPLTERQIFDFFNRSYAPGIVERVIVPRPRGGRGPSLHGRVVFKNTVIPALVMRNCEKVCFSVDGRPLYCRPFVCKKSTTAVTTSTTLSDGGNHSGGDE
ncbi:unnamed protein product [Eruca vesicaria subsp. sativa]|uniref:RRM domain-containing protein n=1 Tax=Eruca vesicaria subsp. sativa TaxID=29727 RepID=A0ABC8JEI7_ERUVS|nr:unnamed protein product [Eruca vesicaria subsp. sativa]